MYRKSVGGKFYPEKKYFCAISEIHPPAFCLSFRARRGRSLAGCHSDSFSPCPLAVVLIPSGLARCGFHFCPFSRFSVACGLLCLSDACGLIWGHFARCALFGLTLSILCAACQCSFSPYGFIFARLRAFAPCGVFPALVVLAAVPCLFSAFPACGGLSSVRAALRAFLGLLSCQYF